MKHNADKMGSEAEKMAAGVMGGKNPLQAAAERKLGKTSKAATAKTGEHARIVIDILVPGMEPDDDEDDYGDEPTEDKDSEKPETD